MHRNSCLQIWVISAQPSRPLPEQNPGSIASTNHPVRPLNFFFIILLRFNQHVLLQNPAPMSLLSNHFSRISNCLSRALTDAIFYRHPRHPWRCFIVTVNMAWILKRTLNSAWQDPMLSELLCLIAVFSKTALSKYSSDLAVFFWTGQDINRSCFYSNCLKYPYRKKNKGILTKTNVIKSKCDLLKRT